MTSILITGGSGTFGRAFALAALKTDAERICIYSRGEHRQAEMRAEIPDPRMRWFIGDVRDKERLCRAMRSCDVVVHAAALKRIEVAEYDVGELVKTNVSGTINVIEAAIDAKVKKVVGISTDKACEPINAYGASKMVGERLMLAANSSTGSSGTQFAVCRYGNVWKSTGSIVPRWQAMIASGETEVPVTDPEATRFFMWAHEATELVLSTIDVMTGGELVTPSLPAYRVGDLVTAMGVSSRTIGLPEWEKRHESMIRGVTSETVRRMSIEELRAAL